MFEFNTKIEIIGINPFVFIPNNILQELFKMKGSNKSPLPIKGNIQDKPYTQTLVKYRGKWRLYINTKMLKNSPNRIGEVITLSVEYDPSDRSIELHPKLKKALDDNLKAKEKFDSLTPSLQKEIVRYISFLKTETSIDRNINRAIGFLLGKESFVGRKPLT